MKGKIPLRSLMVTDKTKTGRNMFLTGPHNWNLSIGKTNQCLTFMKLPSLKYSCTPLFKQQHQEARCKYFLGFFFMWRKILPFCIEVVCTHGSPEASSSCAVPMSGCQQGLRGVFMQESHEPGLCTGQALGLSVDLFHGAGEALQSPAEQRLTLGSVRRSAAPSALCL